MCLRLLRFSLDGQELRFVDFEASVKAFEIQDHIDVVRLYKECCECKAILAQILRYENVIEKCVHFFSNIQNTEICNISKVLESSFSSHAFVERIFLD